MNIFSIIVIAVGLSMDSFAVSIANGLCIKNLTTRKTIVIASFLAVFQAVMPFFGWMFSIGLEKYVTELDHWIAFVLLGFIGGKMIYDGLTSEEDQCSCKELKLFTLICQSFATSIDAFAVGISFAVLNQEIIRPVFIIGIVTFLFSYLGLKLGRLFGQRMERYVEVFGGVVLVGIGLKILIEHTFNLA